ncbi:hypothetical protein AB0I81_42270 [Nonomuraea sp. NPDC050404]|uniref:hypothetical protein n=1 Tax=Nonomuraea sp. NPDC050404 TaxID=3155783 RepID=UPI0033F7AB7A
MTTEQGTGRGAPGRRAVPKAGTRRSATQQPKPRPRTDARREAEGKPSAAERARAEAAGKRPVGERGRAEAAGKRPVGERPVGERGPAEAAGKRVRAAAGREAPPAERARAAAGGKAPVAEGARAAAGGKTPVVERVRSVAAGKRPAGGRPRAEAGPGRTAPRRRPERRQRAPFVLLVVGLLCGGLVSLLLLNTMLAQDAITDSTLRKEIAEAKLVNEQLDQKYQLKTQPENIAKLAEHNGEGRSWDEVNPWNDGATGQAGEADTER